MKISKIKRTPITKIKGEIKEKIDQLLNEGFAVYFISKLVSEIFETSVSAPRIYRYVSKLKKQGFSYKPTTRQCHLNPDVVRKVEIFIFLNRHLSARKISKEFKERFGLAVSHESVYRMIRKDANSPYRLSKVNLHPGRKPKITDAIEEQIKSLFSQGMNVREVSNRISSTSSTHLRQEVLYRHIKRKRTEGDIFYLNINNYKARLRK